MYSWIPCYSIRWIFYIVGSVLYENICNKVSCRVFSRYFSRFPAFFRKFYFPIMVEHFGVHILDDLWGLLDVRWKIRICMGHVKYMYITFCGSYQVTVGLKEGSHCILNKKTKYAIFWCPSEVNLITVDCGLNPCVRSRCAFIFEDR